MVGSDSVSSLPLWSEDHLNGLYVCLRRYLPPRPTYEVAASVCSALLRDPFSLTHNDPAVDMGPSFWLRIMVPDDDLPVVLVNDLLSLLDYMGETYGVDEEIDREAFILALRSFVFGAFGV